MENDELEKEKKKKTTRKKTNTKKEDNAKTIITNEEAEYTPIENNYIPKKNSKFKMIFIILVLLLLIAGLVIWIIKSDVFGIAEKKLEEEKNQIELKHTTSAKVKSEGVYITDVSEVVDEVMPSIVAITSKTIISTGNYGPYYGFGNDNNSKRYTTGAGSGVIVASDDDEIFILTNYHVVEDASELSVMFIDDESCDAKVKGISERKDIAVVSVSKKDMKKSTLEQIKIATLGNSDELKVGNGIIAIGNALGYGQSVTTGVVSALNREIKNDENAQEMIQIDAAINGGNSGGALLNSKGEVVGINRAKYSSNALSSSASIEGMGFAIPISDVEETIKDLINGKNDEGGLLIGVEGYMTNSGDIANYNLPEGFYISKITKGGNAEKSELEIGNIITEVDGNKVTSLDVIKKVLNKKEKGDKITLKVKYPSKNDYKEKTVVITLN